MDESNIRESYASFRRELRQILADNHIYSNPGWNDEDITDSIRQLIKSLRNKIGEQDG